MTSLSGANCLFDTNILVAFLLDGHPHYPRARALFLRLLAKDFHAVVSSQNLFELAAVLVHGYKLQRSSVRKDLRCIREDELVEVIYPHLQTLETFENIVATNPTMHISDIFLLATALSHNVDFIITGDRAFEKIKLKGITIYNPF